MKLIHVFVSLKDSFSGAYDNKIVSRSEETYNKMLRTKGKKFSRFDKQAQIHFNWEVLEVRQATADDYENPLINKE